MSFTSAAYALAPVPCASSVEDCLSDFSAQSTDAEGALCFAIAFGAMEKYTLAQCSALDSSPDTLNAVQRVRWGGAAAAPPPSARARASA